MSAREIVLALCLVAGAALIVAGVAQVNVPAALIAAGLLTAGIGFVFTAEVR